MTGCYPKIATVGMNYPADQPAALNIVDSIKLPPDFNHDVYHELNYADAVFASYLRYGFQPIWLDGNTPSHKANSMIEMIRSARRYGLLPQEYHLYEATRLFSERSDSTSLQRLDALLTDAFLSMSHDLKLGRLHMMKRPLDSLKVFHLTDSISAFDVEVILGAQEPAHDGYFSLKGALNAMLDSIAAKDSSLLNGETNDSIELHRKIQLVEINLERWRWENTARKGSYAWVNVPAYMFYVVDNGNVVLESKVVVGKATNQTPLFSSNIECITIFPYWYVPRKISVQEYLPVIKKDTTFLTRNNFDVLDKSGKVQNISSIDWDKLSANNFPYSLRQREGIENSLGVIKFVFDNPYAVFIHDTNAKELFKNKVRAYSHGCIRLEKAYEFARYLINGRSQISSQTLSKYLNDEKRVTINLNPSMPIHISYFTSDVRDQKLQFYKDIYKKDIGLIRQLYHRNAF